ncbi:MAG TPA: MFS transporter [Gaiellaceae bacterium]|nr:MFS transporter [Gaiellaceae bacterium]
MTATSVLRDRAIRALVASETISMAGSQMTWLVLPWFVLTTTGSPARMSLVVAAEMTPVAIFGLASGAVTMRIGSRRTFLVCDGARALTLASIPTLHALGALSFGVLLAIVFVTGVFMVPSATAQRVVLPELVGEDEARVGQAMSLLQTAQAVAGIAGPALGGILITVLGAANVLYFDAASYAFSFALIALFVFPRYTAPVGDEPSGVLDGVRFLFRDRLLRVWMLSIAGMNVVWSALSVIFPVLVLRRYGEHPEILGWIFGAFGVGSVIGAVGSYRIIGRVDRVLLAGLASAGQTAGLWLLLPDLPWPVVVAAAALTGVFFPTLNACVVTVRTMRTPPPLRPTVHTAAVTVATILSPVGALLAGPALAATSLGWVLLVTLAANTFVGLAITVAGLRNRGTAETAPVTASA